VRDYKETPLQSVAALLVSHPSTMASSKQISFG
jgi:hypothetical protein